MILVQVIARRNACVTRVELHNKHLVHADNMFADPTGELIAKKSLCCSPIELAKASCAVAKSEKNLMLVPMTRAERTSCVFHDGVFSGEVLRH